MVFNYSYLRVIKKSHPEESIQQDLINSVASEEEATDLIRRKKRAVTSAAVITIASLENSCTFNVFLLHEKTQLKEFAPN